MSCGCHLSSGLRRGEGFDVDVGRVRAEFALQENLLAAGVAPHSKRGEVHRQVVPRLLHAEIKKTPLTFIHLSFIYFFFGRVQTSLSHGATKTRRGCDHSDLIWRWSGQLVTTLLE